MRKLIEDKETISVPTLKPRDPNQQILANKKNAGGPMRDKKKEMKRGKEKFKGSFKQFMEALDAAEQAE
jgi:hypothetical protein